MAASFDISNAHVLSVHSKSIRHNRTFASIGDRALIALTGLRNPCQQINAFQHGLLGAMLGHDAEGNLIRKAGVTSVVLAGGVVRPGDPIVVALPPAPHLRLEMIQYIANDAHDDTTAAEVARWINVSWTSEPRMTGDLEIATIAPSVE
jgi:MOSC domain-containing protein YiiM